MNWCMDLLRDGVVVLLLVLQKNDYEIRFNLFGDFFVYRMKTVCVIFLILALCIFAMDDSEHSRRRVFVYM